MTSNIDIYSLPRSGTNLFCSDLVLTFCLRGLNVGGGRRPLLGKPIFSHPKVANEKYATIRDEMKFSFIGPKIFWLDQLAYKIIAKLRDTDRYILIRNPYAIAASMMRYSDRNRTHEHVWDLRASTALNRFCKDFSSMLMMAKRNTKPVPLISVHDYFESSIYRARIATQLKLIQRVDPLACKKGHRIENIEGVMKCDCGDLSGWGGFNPSAHVKSERLADLSDMDRRVARQMSRTLKSMLGDPVEKCFTSKGTVDVSELARLGFNII